jgi:hypothetical protein
MRAIQGRLCRGRDHRKDFHRLVRNLISLPRPVPGNASEDDEGAREIAGEPEWGNLYDS